MAKSRKNSENQSNKDQSQDTRVIRENLKAVVDKASSINKGMTSGKRPTPKK